MTNAELDALVDRMIYLGEQRDAARSALVATEPTQEPVAWQRIDDEDQFMTLPAPMLSMNQWRPLYPAPAQTPMTDADAENLWIRRMKLHDGDILPQIVDLVRAVERHHGIGPARGE
jgi:hypothetical protein